MVLRSVLVLATGALTPSCVTSNVPFEEPRDFPPSIEAPQDSTVRYPLNSVIQIPSELVVEGDGGATPTSISIQFYVRDPNFDQRLTYRAFVDYDPAFSPTVWDEGLIPPAAASNDDRLVRTATSTIPFAPLSHPGCHRVEIFVSGAFLRGRDPVTPGDLGTATWWVATEPEGSTTGVDMTRCP